MSWIRPAGLAAVAALAATTITPAQQPAPAKPYDLGVAVSAVVAKLMVPDGAHVDAGAPLVTMDCAPREDEVKVRGAEAAAAEAAFERVRNGPRPDEIVIGEANVGVAQARAEEAADAFARLRALTEGVSVTRAQLLEGRRDARISAAQLDDARKRLALLREGNRQEDIDEAAARRDAAAADLAMAQAQLAQCTVRAPVPGVVHFVANPGQYVSEAVPVALARLTPDARP